MYDVQHCKEFDRNPCSSERALMLNSSNMCFVTKLHVLKQGSIVFFIVLEIKMEIMLTRKEEKKERKKPPTPPPLPNKKERRKTTLYISK